MADEHSGGNPPAGWYDDPEGAGRRYWDGGRWTEHTEPAEAPAPPPPPPPGPPGPPQAGGAPIPATPGTGPGRPATAGIRLGARIIDSLLVGIPYWVVLGILGLGVSGDLGESLVFSLLWSAIYVGYFVFMESSRGQTIGKQVLNLRTVGPDGGNPTQQQAFMRNAWILVGVVPIIGGFVSLAISIWIGVSISGDPERRGVHDKWAEGTTVVRTA